MKFFTGTKEALGLAPKPTLKEKAERIFGGLVPAVQVHNNFENRNALVTRNGPGLRKLNEVETHRDKLIAVANTHGFTPYACEEMHDFQMSLVHRDFTERAMASFDSATRRLKKFFMHGLVGTLIAFSSWLVTYPALYDLVVGFPVNGNGQINIGHLLIWWIGSLFVLGFFTQDSVAAPKTSGSKRNISKSNLQESEIKERAQKLKQRFESRNEWVPTQKGLETLVKQGRDKNFPWLDKNIEDAVEVDSQDTQYKNLIRWVFVAPIAVPVIAALSLPLGVLSIPFTSRDSGRRWRKISEKRLSASYSQEEELHIVGMVEDLHQIFPGEEIEIIALTERGSQKPLHTYVAVDIKGDVSKKLYFYHIWH